MPATRDELSQAILDRTGLPSGDALAQPAALQAAIKHGQRAYGVEGDWPWLQVEETINTVANTSTYSVAVNYRRTNYLFYQGTDLEPRDARDLHLLDAVSTSSPTLYGVTAGSIVLRPTPNAVYALTHGYQRMEAVLAAGSDPVLLPDAYTDYLVSHAALYIAVRLKDADLATLLRAELKDWRDRMAMEQIRASGSRRLRTVWRGV